MPAPRRRSPLSDTVLLSGWLFADLLLGLLVIMLVSTPAMTADQVVPPTATFTATATATATPSPTPTHTLTPTSTRTPTPTGTATATGTSTPTVTATATETPTPTVTATATETATPVVPIALCLPSIQVGPPVRMENSTAVGAGRLQNASAEIPDDQALIAAFAPFARDESGVEQRVFLVVSFSHIPIRQAATDQQREQNRRLAYERSEKVNQRLREILPNMFTPVTVTYAGGPFDNGDLRQEGKADFWVWFRSDDCDDQGRPR